MHRLSLYDTLLLIALLVVLIFGGYSLYTYHFSTESAKNLPTDYSLETFLLPSYTDHTVGSPTTTFTLIYYTDYDCPFCTNAIELGERLTKQYPNLRVVYRNSPLSALHPEAPQKAILAECLAQKEQSFFVIAQKLFAAQGSTLHELPYATDLVTTEELEACLQNEEAQQRVLREQLEAMNMGLYSTPSAILLKGNAIVLKLNFASEETLDKILPSAITP